VMAWKRCKLISNLANALQVLCANGHHRGDGASPVRAIASRLGAEASACYAAAGLPVIDPATFQAEAGGFQIVAVSGQRRQGGSTWQSVARGLPSVETDFLNGEVVRLGRLHDVPTPVNAAVQARMHDVMLGALEPRTLVPADLLTESAAAKAR
jgi:2-dehydropantoate 2-reductase